MKILVTGAKGFTGKNLCASLKNIMDGKDKTHPDLSISRIYECDIDTTSEELDDYCKNADFVFNIAGVNRTKDAQEFIDGNIDFASRLLSTLKKHKNTCPVMNASSIQAEADNDYGRSKKAGEELFFKYGEETGAKVLVYRFPNLFGKWCRPNYNSVVATFCYNIARDLPITINGRDTKLTMCYIDDVVEELISALTGKEHKDGAYCRVFPEHRVTLGEISDLLHLFKSQPQSLTIPEIPNDSFAKKLYSTYLSYLPKEKVAFPLKTNTDHRGSFTELLKSENCGQVSINISKPGITKGEHWHNTKWEFFIVVAGKGLIRQRKIGSSEVLDFEVSGEEITAVHMLPGYTHNIINLSDTENLVTVMWANESFDPEKPDTFFEPVEVK